MQVLISATEALAMCDATRARRSDPTPEQSERARRNWRAAPAPSRAAAERLYGALRRVMEQPGIRAQLDAATRTAAEGALEAAEAERCR